MRFTVAAVVAALALCCACTADITPVTTAESGVSGVTVYGTAKVGSITDANTFSTPAPIVPPLPATITGRADGSTLHLRVGQSRYIVLSLDGYGPGDDWDRFQVPDGAIRLTDEHGGYPGTQPVRATITAVHPGRTDLTTMSDAHCFYSTDYRCMFPRFRWTLHVIVIR